MGQTAGERFVAAVAARDADGLRAVLGHWFGESDRIDAVDHLEEGDPVADTQRVGYRLAVTNEGGPHLVEQQMYYRERDGRLVYARVVCSGYRRR